jgi:predicted CXXCH cytochrome family protein
MRCAGCVLGLMLCLEPAIWNQASRSDSAVCSTCHSDISESYRHTGMARSFFRPRPENTIENYTNHNTYYHSASDTHFEMIARSGKYFQRQYQIGFDGRETNVSETEVDFILGSGDHARTYLHRTSANKLIELPLGWYAENGGYWAMNPGYDRPDHQGLGRAIGFDCMFCHNAYPEILSGNGPRSDPVFLALKEGIDCERCHGDGREHMRQARTAGNRVEDIRRAIVNPARLPADRQMEICMQCHLETISFSVTNAIVRYERGQYSYIPGERLADFRLHFDQAPEKGDQDRFEIAGTAYRLRLSKCFLKSNGAMTCTTCHDAHAAVPAKEAARRYSTVCRQCHATVLEPLIRARRHTASPDCIGCHMPKRRTQDAVHIVMTDHYIQRRKPARDLLAALPESRRPDYRGQIVPYYPAALTRDEDDLYLGVAQVTENSTRGDGIVRLSAAIAKFHPAPAEFYLQLGDALRASGRFEQAIATYEQAVQREPQSAAALERLALGLMRLQRYSQGEAVFREALNLVPGHAETWANLGTLYLEQHRTTEAVAAFEKSLTIDPELPETHNSLGGARMQSGDSAGAEAEFREAIRLRPHYAEAHHNLANVLSAAGRSEEARYHFEAALRIRENHSATRFDYAVMLFRIRHPDEAQHQIESLLRSDPGHAQGHDLLGTLLAAKGQTAKAIEQFRRAVQLAPGFARAKLDLGAALAKSGDRTAALPYLEKAAQSRDAGIHDEAQKLIESIR